MMDFGKKENGIQKEDEYLQMEMSIWVSINKDKSMEMAVYKLQMKKELLLYILVALKMIKYKGKVNYRCRMEYPIQEAGWKIKNMASDNTIGQMDGNTKENF